MDDLTLHAYATNAAELAHRYAGASHGIARHFALAFRAGDRILDVGAGSGRDLALLVGEGHAAYGVEPVEAMRAEALRRHPELHGKLHAGSLPGLPKAEILGGPFDAILCSAVLQHLPRSALFDAAFALRGLLRPGGRVLLSIPLERGELDAQGRDRLGRLFNRVAPAELELLFQRIGFRTISRCEEGDSLGRGELRWAVLLLESARHEGAPSARPLDRIEAVLRQDRKVATYKLALLRALTDIATTRARAVEWRADGRVAVPIQAVVDLWIEYYWPLFANAEFLPQMSGEAEAGQHKLAFSARLLALMERFQGSGGLAGFLSQVRDGKLDEAARPLVQALRSSLRNAIRTGPVHHAGRSTSGALFGYEQGSILVDGELWQEISLMGHWVRDSLLVRWAELSARLADAADESREDVLQRSLGVLLTPALPVHATRHARGVFAALPERSCVWTERRLGSDFAIDHVIPFTLWHNNDLWNLLPAACAVNNKKRDRLPARQLLLDRKGAIVDCWRALHAKLPTRFEAELSHLTGSRVLDYDGGFEALCEAVEVTAIQRSCARWRP